jgi:hypothetical protein
VILVRVFVCCLDMGILHPRFERQSLMSSWPTVCFIIANKNLEFTNEI